MEIGRALSRLRRRVSRPLLNGLRRPFLMARMARAREVRLLGYRFRTHPEVFHPVYFMSSRVLAEHVVPLPLRGVRVLDMGTGSGPIAVAAAAAGAEVIACDVNPRAVALARENLALNGLRAEVVESDLFAELSGRTFDFICFNVPFYAGDPRTRYEHAFKAGRDLGTIKRFAAGCAEHLADAGSVLVVYSEDCDGEAMQSAFTDRNFVIESERVVRRMLEDFHVVCFRKRAVAGS